MIMISPIIDDVHFAHWIGVMSARLLHCKLTYSLLISIVWVDTLKLCELPCQTLTFKIIHSFIFILRPHGFLFLFSA